MEAGSAQDELTARARKGDAEAFVALCELYRTRIWRIVASVSRGSDAEDLAQEVVLRAYRGLPRYQGEAPFEAWLCRIAVNVTHDHLRSAWRRRVTLFERVPAEPGETAEHPEGMAERRELQRRVRKAVARLPENQRVPIWLHYFEGFSLAEVARLELTPEATVRSRVRAGLKRLSLSLEDLVPVVPESACPLGPDMKGCGA